MTTGITVSEIAFSGASALVADNLWQAGIRSGGHSGRQFQVSAQGDPELLPP